MCRALHDLSVTLSGATLLNHAAHTAIDVHSLPRSSASQIKSDGWMRAHQNWRKPPDLQLLCSWLVLLALLAEPMEGHMYVT